MHFYKDQHLLVEGPLTNLVEYVLHFPKPKVPYNYKPGTYHFNQLTAALSTHSNATVSMNSYRPKLLSGGVVPPLAPQHYGVATGGADATGGSSMAFMHAMTAAAASYFGSGGGGMSANTSAPPGDSASHAAAYAVAAAAAASVVNNPGGVFAPLRGGQNFDDEQQQPYLFDQLSYIGSNQQFAAANVNSSKLLPLRTCLISCGGVHLEPDLLIIVTRTGGFVLTQWFYIPGSIAISVSPSSTHFHATSPLTPQQCSSSHVHLLVLVAAFTLVWLCLSPI